MTARRDFLRGLVSLPLIGGGVTLIGQPTAVAEPLTDDLLQAYKTWLHYEGRCLSWEIARRPDMVDYYGGDHVSRYKIIDRQFAFVGASARYHSFDGQNPASSRAALVMSTVGCDWREDGR